MNFSQEVRTILVKKNAILISIFVCTKLDLILEQNVISEVFTTLDGNVLVPIYFVGYTNFVIFNKNKTILRLTHITFTFLLSLICLLTSSMNVPISRSVC